MPCTKQCAESLWQHAVVREHPKKSSQSSRKSRALQQPGQSWANQSRLDSRWAAPMPVALAQYSMEESTFSLVQPHSVNETNKNKAHWLGRSAAEHEIATSAEKEEGVKLFPCELIETPVMGTTEDGKLFHRPQTAEHHTSILTNTATTLFYPADTNRRRCGRAIPLVCRGLRPPTRTCLSLTAKA